MESLSQKAVKSSFMQTVEQLYTTNINNAILTEGEFYKLRQSLL